MLDAAETAVKLSVGRHRNDLDKDQTYELAMIRLIEVIGEAANNVSEHLRDVNPQIPWVQVIGARNHLIHGYFDLNRDRIWDILADDLPVLIKNLKEILKGLT